MIDQRSMWIRLAAVACACLTGVGTAAEDAATAVPFLRVSAYRVPVGDEVRLTLRLPTGEGWRRANIGRLIARSGARQWSIPVAPRDGEEFLSVRFNKPGPVLLVVSAGGEAEKARGDAWRRTTYCAKVVLFVEAAAAGAGAGRDVEAEPAGASGGITAKVGERMEVLPLVDPTSLGVGDDLPVRVYYEGQKMAGAAVRAETWSGDGAAEGAAVSKNSDAVGTVWFRIDRAGRWVIRTVRSVDGVEHVGELQFEIPASSAEGGRTRPR